MAYDGLMARRTVLRAAGALAAAGMLAVLGGCAWGAGADGAGGSAGAGAGGSAAGAGGGATGASGSAAAAGSGAGSSGAAGTSASASAAPASLTASGPFTRSPRAVDGYTFMQGTQQDRGFTVDDALATPGGRTLHFSLHIPDAYDGSAPYALYVACPGWEGLYFQGVGANLQEDYPFVANGYVPDMIVASLQLDDWGAISARDTITATQWLMAAFNIDPARVYLSGCSGGGETISLVLGMRPDLYRRALHTISRWDGDVNALADAQVPVYLAIGENDDYYGSGPARATYQEICDAYRARGLSDDRIAELVVLDVKPASYFTDRGFTADASQHAAGGYLFVHDEQIMGWLFP